MICKFDVSNPKGITGRRPCYVCGLGVRRVLRKDCPYRKSEEKAAALLKRFLDYYKSIGEALKDVRELRRSGEPGKSDRMEIEKLVSELNRHRQAYYHEMSKVGGPHLKGEPWGGTSPRDGP